MKTFSSPRNSRKRVHTNKNEVFVIHSLSSSTCFCCCSITTTVIVLMILIITASIDCCCNAYSRVPNRNNRIQKQQLTFIQQSATLIMIPSSSSTTRYSNNNRIRSNCYNNNNNSFFRNRNIIRRNLFNLNNNGSSDPTINNNKIDTGTQYIPVDTIHENDYDNKNNNNNNNYNNNNNNNNFDGNGSIYPDWLDAAAETTQMRFFGRDAFLNLFIPFVSPFIAYITFDYIASSYHTIIEVLASFGEGGKNWVAVDGGAYQAKIMTPAINGLVVPAMALLFATLTSTTITTLRQRQVDVRNAINIEAGEIRALECLVDAFQNGFVQDLSRDYLIQYTTRILAECHPRLGSGSDVINPRRGMDSELNGFTGLINKQYGTEIIPAHIADECYTGITRLREQRTRRITALQSVYPFLHYVILFVLASAECIAFLMETDQDLLIFLNAIQIKILWSMLIGTFVTCFTVFWDLLAPFSGSYHISASVGQLHTIKLTLQASKQMSEKVQQQQQDEKKKKNTIVSTSTQQKFLDLNGGSNIINNININGSAIAKSNNDNKNDTNDDNNDNNNNSEQASSKKESIPIATGASSSSYSVLNNSNMTTLTPNSDFH